MDDEKSAAQLFDEWRPWLEWQARHRAQCGPLRVVDFESLPDAPPFVTSAAEERYRRGYWHGYSQAMDDLRVAYSKSGTHTARWWAAWQRVARFFDAALTRWRHESHKGNPTPPPHFGVGQWL